MHKFWICLLALAIMSRGAISQVSPAASSIPIKNTKINDRPMNIFGVLAQKYKVVIDLYGTRIGSDSRTLNISAESGTLKDLLDARCILRMNPCHPYSTRLRPVRTHISGLPSGVSGGRLKGGPGAGRRAPAKNS